MKRGILLLGICWFGGIFAQSDIPEGAIDPAVLSQAVPVSVFPEKVLLIINNQEIDLPVRGNEGIIHQVPQQYWVVGGRKMKLETQEALGDITVGRIETRWTETVDADLLSNWLAQKGFAIGDATDNSVEILLDEEGNPTFSGAPKSTLDLDIDALTEVLNQTHGFEYPIVRVTAPEVFSEVVVPTELAERGIVEVIGIGFSDFVGSSPSRVQNIIAAGDRMQGVIVPQGEMFSFNTVLDDVSPDYGFVKEKVINGGRIRYEFGGGVCQVSTTVYRAALNAAMDITNRRSHSWVVPYYGQPGLDATIYLGAQDLEFRNDTPGDVLLQYDIDGTELRFIVYGTSDGRSTKLQGPVINNHRGIPAPIRELDSNLSPGQEVYKEGGIKGFDATWEYTIIRPDGTEEVEQIVSKYSAKAPLVLYGPTPEPEPEPVSETINEPAVEGIEISEISEEYPVYCAAGGCAQ